MNSDKRPKANFTFKGKTGEEKVVLSLVDTQAKITLIPEWLANELQAQKTGRKIPIVGITGICEFLPEAEVEIFPWVRISSGRIIKNAKILLKVIVSSSFPEPIIGLDILGNLIEKGLAVRYNVIEFKQSFWQALKDLLKK